jgi:hypothetical protein
MPKLPDAQAYAPIVYVRRDPSSRSTTAQTPSCGIPCYHLTLQIDDKGVDAPAEALQRPHSAASAAQGQGLPTCCPLAGFSPAGCRSSLQGTFTPAQCKGATAGTAAQPAYDSLAPYRLDL